MPLNYNKWENLNVSDDDDNCDDYEPRLQYFKGGTVYRLPKKHSLHPDNPNVESRSVAISAVRAALTEISDIEKKLTNGVMDEKTRKELETKLYEAKNRYVEIVNEKRDETNDCENVCSTATNKTSLNKVPVASAEMIPLSEEEFSKQKQLADECEWAFIKLSQLTGSMEMAHFFRQYPTLFSSRTADILMNMAITMGKAKQYDQMTAIIKQSMRISYALNAASILQVKQEALSHFLVGYFTQLERCWNAEQDQTLNKIRAAFLQERPISNDEDGPSSYSADSH